MAEYTYSDIFNMAIQAVKSMTPGDDLDEVDEEFMDELLEAFILKVGRAMRKLKLGEQLNKNNYDDNFIEIASYLNRVDDPNITFKLQSDLKDYFMFLGDDREKIKFGIDVKDFGERKFFDDEDEDEDEEEEMTEEEMEYGFKKGGLIKNNKYKPAKYIINKF